MTSEQNVSIPAGGSPASSTSKVALVSLILLIVGTVAFALIAPAIAPSAEDPNQGAIGLAVAMIIVIAGSFVGFVVIGTAMSASRKGAGWAGRASLLMLVVWIALVALVVYLLTGS